MNGHLLARVRFPLVVLFVFLIPAAARSQYEESNGYEPSEIRMFTAGAEWQDVAPRSTNTDSSAFRYTRIMPMVGFRQGSAEFTFGYTKFSENNASHSSVFLGTLFTRELFLEGNPKSALILPLVISANYTRTESGGVERNNFSIAAIGLGTGLGYRQTSRSVDASVGVEGIVHYALEGLSTGSGFSGAVIGELAFFFPDAWIGDGIGVGYRFRYQTWSMSEPKFNYRVISHGPYIGISF